MTPCDHRRTLQKQVYLVCLLKNTVGRQGVTFSRPLGRGQATDRVLSILMYLIRCETPENGLGTTRVKSSPKTGGYRTRIGLCRVAQELFVEGVFVVLLCSRPVGQSVSGIVPTLPGNMVVVAGCPTAPLKATRIHSRRSIILCNNIGVQYFWWRRKMGVKLSQWKPINRLYTMLRIVSLYQC